MKFLRGLLLSGLVLGGMASAGAQTSPAVAPSPLPGFFLPNFLMARPGQTVNVDIWADSRIKDLIGAHFILNFRGKSDATAPPLEFIYPNPTNPAEIALQVGPLLPSPLLATGLKNQEVSIVMVLLTDNIVGNGPGWIISVPIHVPENEIPGTVYGLQLLKHDALGADGKIFPSRTTSCLLTIDPDAPMPGDVNGDGKTDILDISMALRIAVRTMEPTDRQLYAADVFPKDGVVTITDIVSILRRLIQSPKMAEASRPIFVPLDRLPPHILESFESNDEFFPDGSSAPPF